MLGWAIGLYGGRPYLERHGRWLHLDEQKLDRAERWFERWEDWAVFFGRLTPVIRSFVSIPAGVMETPLVRYTLLTLAGSAIWCFAFAGAGGRPGRDWEDIHHAFSYLDYLAAGAVLAALAWLAIRRLRRRREPRNPRPEGERFGRGPRVHSRFVTAPIPLIDVKAQYAPLLPRIRSAIDEVLEGGQFVFGPNVARSRRRPPAISACRRP